MQSRLREVRDQASGDVNAGRRSPTTISNTSRALLSRVQGMGVVQFSQYLTSKAPFPTGD